MSKTRHLPLEGYPAYDNPSMMERSHEFLEMIKTRRTVRFFNSTPIPRDVVVNCVKAAATAPSGANRQPWHFVIVEESETKRTIREAAESEEIEFYNGRASDEWLEALEPFGTDEHKPFLELAPYLIVVFQEVYGLASDNKRVKNYYVPESVGIASGFLIAALHHAGVATLTHTPSPMKFLQELLGRPANERAMMIVVAGLPAQDATVPVLVKKPFEEICTIIDQPSQNHVTHH